MTNIRYTLAALVCCSLVGAVSAQTIYKVVNKDGTVTYTDRPVEGAQAIDVKTQNLVSMPSAVKAPAKPVRKTTQKPLPAFELSMVTPTDGQTIRNNNGTLQVAGNLTPAGNGAFQLFMDETLVDTQPAPVFSLQNVDRGEHKLQIKFLHNSGKVLATTPVHTVYLHRASALSRPN